MPWAFLKASSSANAALPYHTLQLPDTALRCGLLAPVPHSRRSVPGSLSPAMLWVFFRRSRISLFILETGQNELSQTLRANILKIFGYNTSLLNKKVQGLSKDTLQRHSMKSG